MGELLEMEASVADTVDARMASAAAHYLAGHLDWAESLWRRILVDNPDNLTALTHLGLIAGRTGHGGAAVKIFRRAATLSPDSADIQTFLGDALFDTGEVPGAIEAYKMALQAQPQFLAAQVNLTNTYLHTGDLADAEVWALAAVSRDPECAAALSNLGQIFLKTGRLTAAVKTLRLAAARADDKGQALTNLGAALQISGDVDGAIDAFQRALAGDPNCHLAERNLLISVLNQVDISGAAKFALHQRYGARHVVPGARRKNFSERDRRSDRRLRIGYVSSDFRDHPVGRNLLPLIEHHNRREFEIILYAEDEMIDDVSARFRSLADQWISTRGLSDAVLAERIRRDQVDILVFLAGRFNLNRSLIAQHRSAPVQISFHDCATSGLEEMDYWLTDEYLHPKDSAERFTESLHRLPVFYQFAPPSEFPEPGEAPCIDNGYVSFGCFNKPEKMNEDVAQLWLEILKATPNSKLVLKYRNYFADDGVAQIWRDRFSSFGLAADRLILLGSDDQLDDHLALYRQIDIALDPFPFNGATTTFEALAMGAPVIALWGDGFVSRVAAALMSQVGLGDFAAPTKDQYVRCAVALAEDTPRISELRRGLRLQVLNSSLCNGTDYAETVETAFRSMWRNWCAGGLGE